MRNETGLKNKEIMVLKATLDNRLKELLILLKEKETSVVAAGILDEDRFVPGFRTKKDGVDIHAERDALNNFLEEYGEPGSDAWVVTTLSPCFRPNPDRFGSSCCQILAEDTHLCDPIRKFHTGFIDPLQLSKQGYRKEYDFRVSISDDPELKVYCEKLFDWFRKDRSDKEKFISESLNSLDY